jgi:deoxyribodipyrimidine photo-lyase
LTPGVKWDEAMRTVWQPGTAGVQEQLERFLRMAVWNYRDDRNRPDFSGTSRMSPHLHSGELTTCQIWHAVRRKAEA